MHQTDPLAFAKLATMLKDSPNIGPGEPFACVVLAQLAAKNEHDPHQRKEVKLGLTRKAGCPIPAN
ncbi:hypothetical protein HH1059_03850 [Halorhodospira halochloris]|uniref:Uncharacterized protein n=1 Tax=Halorhodospira halochloris TaxID=1052 RepID=A0A2Z6EZA7_HALHR|nr:hypothetical protein [Halorhodospira halochloris]MBK1652942.1 hypothetical protein [Halorhodospira halochloris]BBE10977.1 hypothetical protein HH1059_03850 [Halorhodospira halochloris]